jgi:hypothetical protein
VRYLIIALFCAAPLFCAIDSAHYILNQNETKELKIEYGGQWIAINHTPQDISLTIDTQNSTIRVKALKREINALVEVALIDLDDSYYLAFSSLRKNDPHRLFLRDKKPNSDVKIIGAKGDVSIDRDFLVYKGIKSGYFHIEYIDRRDRIRRKYVGVSKRGLYIFESVLEVLSEESGRLIFDSTFAIKPEIIIEPQNGDAYIEENSLVYYSGAIGEDQLVFALDNEPIALSIKVFERLSEIYIGGAKQRSFYRRFDGVYQKAHIDLNGTLSFFCFDDKERLFTLIAPPRSELTARDDGSFWLHYDQIDLLIGRDLAVKGIANGKTFNAKRAKQITVDLLGNITVSNDTL